MSGGWKEEYLSSLQANTQDAALDLELVRTCSQLQDRIAALEAEKAVLEAAQGTRGTPNTTPKKPPSKGPEKDDSNSAQEAKLRLDIAEALRSKGQFEARLRAAEEELAKLRNKTSGDARAIKNLTDDRTSLGRKLRDREHELREKQKLVENVQDEMITLHLQLNIAERERDKAKKENEALIARWKKRVEQEVDAMNLANEPIFEKSR